MATTLNERTLKEPVDRFCAPCTAFFTSPPLTLLLPPTEKQEWLSDEVQQEVCLSPPKKMWWIRAPARQAAG